MNEQAIFARLRQPFADDAIKWKIQTNPREGDTYALCVAYIDARDVAARLNEVVGINWESNFGEIIAFSDGKKTEWGVPCRLTVMGHTRTDIGTLSATEPLKGGYSDALKRAAVQFGIAAYVYSFPVVKAEVQRAGRSYYFTSYAKGELAQLVSFIHSGGEARGLPKFRAIKVRDYAPIRFDSPCFGESEEGDGVQDVPDGDDLVEARKGYGALARRAAACGIDVLRLRRDDDLGTVHEKMGTLLDQIKGLAIHLREEELGPAPGISLPAQGASSGAWLGAVEEMQDIIKQDRLEEVRV